MQNVQKQPSILLDCTLRDGGYYNNWDFSLELINNYLAAMSAIAVDYVELGFRSLGLKGFKGPCAYTKDSFIRQLNIPKNIKIGVMVNASDLLNHPNGIEQALEKLFTPQVDSPVSLVRIACHVHEFAKTLPASSWLKEKGYLVGINIMQIAEQTLAEIEKLALQASQYDLDVLYFADSMGSLNPAKTTEIINALKAGWKKDLGIHTHDNMGHALANSMCAAEEGVRWIDATVTGMGRGPGNAKTEYVVIEMEKFRDVTVNITPLLLLISKYFKPMQDKCGWGANTYYYLAGKYGIHPTYIQEMLTDRRYGEEDILAVINHLKKVGGKKFSPADIDWGKHFYTQQTQGAWKPEELIAGREVLILGSGAGTASHQKALEYYILQQQPVVIALNGQSGVNSDLIDLRAACHPVRLVADCTQHMSFKQPLIAPVESLPQGVREALQNKKLFDFSLSVVPGVFEFHETGCVLPTALVAAYAFAIAASGRASRILLAGFDGYSSDDPRRKEMNDFFVQFQQKDLVPPLLAVTPTAYDIPSGSIYSLIN